MQSCEVSRSGLPDVVARLAQADRELHVHIPRALVSHRVVDLVQLLQQKRTVLKDESIDRSMGVGSMRDSAVDGDA